jgi:Regulator of chromosome condensation (RCC1) repeat
MRFTRRLLDRRASGTLAIASTLAISGAAWSCADDSKLGPIDSTDASPDVASSTPDATAEDAPQLHDASVVDAAPLPIVCASSSCATSLVTTLGASPNSRSEGFCALMQDGTVVCWGANDAGQLGRDDDAKAPDSATPARVVGLSEIVSLNHTCAIDKNGATFCWGTGPFLQSDAEPLTTERTPVKLPIPPATRVSVSRETACAVIGGGVSCWGSNADGQVAPLDIEPRSATLAPRQIPVAAGSPIHDLIVGRATFILRDDGTIESWGANPPLGRRSPLFPDPNPRPIALGGFSAMDLMDDSACAAAAGVGYCWGSVVPKASDPPIDSPNLTNALPEAVAMPEPVVQIAATPNVVNDDFGAPIVQPRRWCASTTLGNVYCWGYNASGQAGDGTKDHAYKAVKVDGLPAPAAQVKTTPDATCALLTTGKVYCWGSNFYGQIGNGKIKIASLVPQELVLP